MTFGISPVDVMEEEKGRNKGADKHSNQFSYGKTKNVEAQDAEVSNAEKRHADTRGSPEANGRKDEDHDWEDPEGLISTLLAVSKRCKSEGEMVTS